MEYFTILQHASGLLVAERLQSLTYRRLCFHGYISVGDHLVSFHENVEVRLWMLINVCFKLFYFRYAATSISYDTKRPFRVDQD